MVLVLAAPSLASAEPSPAGGAGPSPWAYGFLKTYSVGPRTASDGWQYQGNATIGYSVIIGQTNSTTDPSDFELTVERTMGVLFSIEFCNPSCSSPTSYWTLSYHAWEALDASANFTTSATVNVLGGFTAKAIGLLNSSTTLKANLTEVAHSDLLGAGGEVTRSKYLSANISGMYTVNLSTPLGLIPLTLTPGESWTSSSDFTASGAAEYRYYYHFVGPLLHETVGPINGYFAVSPSGSITVGGTYVAGQSVSFGGVTYPALELNYSIVGALAVREGFILIPATADIFDSSSAPWSANQSGAATVELAALDASPEVGDHVGIAASKLTVDSTSANPGDAGALGGTSVPASASGSNPVSVASVQGTPESTGQATANQACLTSGTGCPGVVSSPSVKNLLASVGLIAGVAAVAVLIALVLIAERRRVPPPTFPNANLYPPGVTTGAPPQRPPAPPPTPEEDDPLDHLW